MLPAGGRPQEGAGRGLGRPAVLLCNPYYQAYLGAALALEAEPVFLNASATTGHLPDLERLAAEPALLDRAIALYLCSPANPQGAVADAAYIGRALELARVHDFMLFLDECYSELYAAEPPTGGPRGRRPDARAVSQPRGVQLALQAVEPARLAFRILRGRCRLPASARRDPEPRRAADARPHTARVRRNLERRAPRGRQSAGLSCQV